MKIKTDFVTNSSSTSYIIYVPDNLVIEDFTETKFSKFNEHATKKGIIEAFSVLKGGTSIWRDYSDGLDFNCDDWEQLLIIVDSIGLIVLELDTGPEDAKIVKLDSKDIHKALVNWRKHESKE